MGVRYVGVYQRYDFMPEMRDAITKWERNLQEIVRDVVGQPCLASKRRTPCTAS